MFDPLDKKNGPLLKALKRAKLLAFFSLTLEKASTSLWRIATWLLFFCGLWLFELPQLFGLWSAIPVLLIFVFGIFYFLKQDVGNFHLPCTKELEQRIETDTHLPHRPLESLKDSLANPEKIQTHALWQSRQERLPALLSRLKIAPPKAMIAGKDPYGLRMIALIFFACGILIAGPQSLERLNQGLMPVDFTSGKATKSSDFTFWITPPEYTGLPQIVLNGQAQDEPETLRIAQGSILKLSLQGRFGAPALFIDNTPYKLTRIEKHNFLLEMEIKPGSSLRLRHLFLTRAQWDFEFISDHSPQITQAGEPEALPEGGLRFPLTLYDDYGVQDLSVTMKLDEIVEDAPLGEPIIKTRSVMSGAASTFEIQPVYDFTAHSWAGLPVTFTFEAYDHNGQSARLEPIKTILPERIFTHPVAQKLIVLRKKLIWSPKNDYEALARDIEALLMRPVDFEDDKIAFLAMRAAASRLLWSPPTLETSKSVVVLLWDTALRLEDGNLSLAARDLREAQMALEEALKNPEMSEAEISQLMRNLREAMAEYFMELQREMQKQKSEGQIPPMVSPDMLSQMIDPDALRAFLDQMESAMRSGERSSAQEMLSRLQRLLDMMNPSLSAPMPPDIQMMSKGINELQELIERQEDLLTQTRAQMQNFSSIKDIIRNYGIVLPENKRAMDMLELESMPPAPSLKRNTPLTAPKINTQPNKVEQEALRYILGQLMLDADKILDNIPKDMGLAEQEMRGSATALDKNEPQTSVSHQEKVLEHLKKAQEDLTQQMIARMEKMTGMMISGSRGMRTDPLGRPYGDQDGNNSMFPGSKVKIPDEAEHKQAQEILKLLRKRSGEFKRPSGELDYYRRLLRQF